MTIYPCYYFQKLAQEIHLSPQFGIKLRNPHHSEIEIFAHNIQMISQILSDQEKRSILFQLYPLGDIPTQGSLDEQFNTEITKHWVLIESQHSLPLEQDLLDYGYLFAYTNDEIFSNQYTNFICDPSFFNPHKILPLLKHEIQYPSDLTVLESKAIALDRLFIQQNKLLRPITEQLRKAQHSHDIKQKLIHYCIAIEILLVHNPSDRNGSKMPMHRQFASKLALVRYLALQNQQQWQINSPFELQDTFYKIYDFRSNILHGRAFSCKDHQVQQYINLLYPSMHLCLDMFYKDETFIDFINKI